MNTDEKVVLASATIALITLLSVALVLYPWQQEIRIEGTSGLSFTPYSVHCTVTFRQNGLIVFEQYHAGAVTLLGLNQTFAKLIGNSTLYNMTLYNLNNTFISIGNQYATWVCNTSQTGLPGEWNRTAALPHDPNYSTVSINLTAVFHPDTGPYTADCIAVNFEDGIGNNAQFCYDTFGEVSGIDNTFTITVEFKISAT